MLALILAVAIVPGRVGAPLYKGKPAASTYSLPQWRGLTPAAARLAAGPLEKALAGRSPTPENVQLALAQAAPEAAALAAEAVASLEAAASVGLEDVRELELVLRGLAAYGAEASASHQRVTTLLAMDSAGRIADKLKPTRFVSGVESSGLPRLSRALERRSADERRTPPPVRPQVVRAAGLALTAGSVLVPALLAAGLALLGLARWMTPRVVTPEPDLPPKPGKGTLERWKGWWRRIVLAQDRQRHLSASGSMGEWLMGAFRAALYAMPVALAGMLAGTLLSFGAAAKGEPSAALMGMTLWGALSGYVAKAVAAQTVFLGLLGRLPLPAVVLLWAPVLLLAGFPLANVLPLLGIQAGIVWAYQRSGSLLVAASLQGLLALIAIDASRLTAALKFATGATLVGLPPFWAGLAVAGMLVLIFRPKAEAARLERVGEDWRRDTAKPRPLWGVLSAGMLWAAVTYVAGDLMYWATTLVSPVTEPAPEILKRMLSLPMDVILFNFVIVAALEEWVFRKGVHQALADKFKKWFWPVALVSSAIFSAAHFIDYSSLLDSELAAGLAGAYAWSWAGFLARVTAGMALAYAYWRSGTLIVPMVAHFFANTMESVGLKWGLTPFLVAMAAMLLLQRVQKR